MPRTLSAARVRVPADHEAEWLAVAAQLAALLEKRGHHLWVFRAEQDPERWLEFSENADRAGHRSVAERTVEELTLEARLRVLAKYEPDASALWSEVSLPKDH